MLQRDITLSERRKPLFATPHTHILSHTLPLTHTLSLFHYILFTHSHTHTLSPNPPHAHTLSLPLHLIHTLTHTHSLYLSADEGIVTMCSHVCAEHLRYSSSIQYYIPLLYPKIMYSVDPHIISTFLLRQHSSNNIAPSIILSTTHPTLPLTLPLNTSTPRIFIPPLPALLPCPQLPQTLVVKI